MHHLFFIGPSSSMGTFITGLFLTLKISLIVHSRNLTDSVQVYLQKSTTPITTGVAFFSKFYIPVKRYFGMDTITKNSFIVDYETENN